MARIEYRAASPPAERMMQKCPVCLDPSECMEAGRHKEYTLRLCPACDVVFSDPMRNPGSEWYEEGYVDENAMINWLPISNAWWHEQFLMGGKKYGETLLDVGCGTGAFLFEAKKLGYKVRGIDFNSNSLKIAREKFGLDEVERMSIEDLREKDPGVHFDVVTFFEVLEHMESPPEFISLVKKLLKPGGVIALSVPNRNRTVDTLGECDCPPHHLTRWSGKALRAFLERSGFEILELKVRDFTKDDLGYVFTQKLITRAKKRLTSKVASSEGGQKPFAYRHYGALKKLKGAVMGAALLPVMPVVKLTRPQGWTIYVAARMK